MNEQFWCKWLADLPDAASISLNFTSVQSHFRTIIPWKCALSVKFHWLGLTSMERVTNYTPHSGEASAATQLASPSLTALLEAKQVCPAVHWVCGVSDPFTPAGYTLLTIIISCRISIRSSFDNFGMHSKNTPLSLHVPLRSICIGRVVRLSDASVNVLAMTWR